MAPSILAAHHASILCLEELHVAVLLIGGLRGCFGAQEGRTGGVDDGGPLHFSS
jgi:hypothetical protein